MMDKFEIVPEKKHSSMWAIVVSIILAAVVFGGIGFWYGTMKEREDLGKVDIVSLTPVASGTGLITKTATPLSSATATVSTTATASASATATQSVGISPLAN